MRRHRKATQQDIDKSLTEQREGMTMNRRKVNVGFICGIILLLSSLLEHSLYVYSVALKEPDLKLRPSALIYSLQGLFFGGYILLFPIAACLPELSYRESMKCKENCRNAATHYLNGAIATSLPFVLHTIVWNILSIPVNPLVYPEHTLIFDGIYKDLYAVHGGVYMYLIISIGMFACGGVISFASYVCRVKGMNHMSAFICPIAFYYIWLKCAALIDGKYVPMPADLFNDGLTLTDICSSALIYSAILLMLIWLYKGRTWRKTV